MTPQPPLNSVTGIEALVVFALQVFTQIFSLFHHQGVPTSVAPQIAAHLNSTPGMTEEHKAIVQSAVSTAVAAHNAAN